MDELEQILEHHGIKGMKWGVRKKRAAPSGPTPVVTKVVPGKKVKAAGGQHHSPAQDAIDAAVTRQKARKSSVDSLSNTELRALVQRMQLEQQYSQLKANRQSPAKKFALSLLGNVGKQQATGLANQYATQQVAKLMAKKAVGAA